MLPASVVRSYFQTRIPFTSITGDRKFNFIPGKHRVDLVNINVSEKFNQTIQELWHFSQTERGQLFRKLTGAK